MVSVDVKHHVYLLTLPLSTPLCPPGDQSVSDACVTWLCNYYAPPPLRRDLIVTQVGVPFVRWVSSGQRGRGRTKKKYICEELCIIKTHGLKTFFFFFFFFLGG